MPSYTQTDRILKFTSPLGANKLLAMRLQGNEAISELFDYTIDVVAEPETAVDPAKLVGQRVTMEMRVTDAGDKRYFNGIVASLEASGGNEFFHFYRIRMMPALWLLSLNTQTRVFQDKSVVEIVRAVLSPYSIVPDVKTTKSYPSLEYCTQYRETDLHFLQRLLEQHGIFYFFNHTATDHTLVLADSTGKFQECPIVSSFRFGTLEREPLTFYEARVHEFMARSTLITGEETSWEYRFIPYARSETAPQAGKSSGPMASNSHEHYDFSDSAAAVMKTPDGDAKVSDLQSLLQGVARERNEAGAVQCDGASTANTMQAGHTFTLSEFPQTDQNRKYVLTQVKHTVAQRPAYRSDMEVQSGHPYINHFQARPSTQAYRKERTATKPRVSGVVTGKVVTRGESDSYLDKYGRVCVQFWWERSTAPKTPDKTLLRVAQQWAGKGWGTYFWPRVGDEVLIDFVEGDPDAPIVVGSVYNGRNRPKYDPASQYTRSGVLTRSSERGGEKNANELRFEDKTGAEQIFLNAERDMDHRIENDSRRWVGNRDSIVVQEDQLTRVGRDQHLTVLGDAKQSVSGSMNLAIGPRLVIQASTQITLRVAGSFLTLGPEGVAVSGPMVRINSGGTPGTIIDRPLTPDDADDGSKGGKM